MGKKNCIVLSFLVILETIFVPSLENLLRHLKSEREEREKEKGGEMREKRPSLCNKYVCTFLYINASNLYSRSRIHFNQHYVVPIEFLN